MFFCAAFTNKNSSQLNATVPNKVILETSQQRSRKKAVNTISQTPRLVFTALLLFASQANAQVTSTTTAGTYSARHRYQQDKQWQQKMLKLQVVR